MKRKPKLVHKSLLKPKKQRVTLNIKVFPDEAKSFKGKADKYFKGNFTALCRQAILSYTPKNSELRKLD